MAAQRASESEKHAARAAAWRAEDPERHKESVRLSRLRRLEKNPSYERDCWAANPERAAANTVRVRQYRRADPENNNNAQARARRAADPERFREWFRRYRAENLEAVKIYGAARRARKRGAAGGYSKQDAAEIRQMQRDRCAICDARLHGGGELDHIIALSRGGSNFRRNLQWTCMPCNRAKRAIDPIDFMRRRGLLL